MNKDRLELLRRLTTASGVAGFESEVTNIIARELKQITRISYDKMGSIICEKRGTNERPKVMLAGHMDEIGFMVKFITEDGFIKFTMLGLWTPMYLLSQRVVIKTHKGNIPGVIGYKPWRKVSDEEKNKAVNKKDLYIDIGAKDKKDATKLGIRPGDPIIPEAPFLQMANPDGLLAKAWDDRAGCALFISVLKALKNKRHPNTIFGVGTVQEELGVRGARTSASKINPDIAVICEVAEAQDIPGSEPKGQTALGKGPVITIYDSGMIPNLKLRDFVIDVAEKQKIPYQLGVSEGFATDAYFIHIHSEGVPSIDIDVPTRYMHTHAGIIYQSDFDNTTRLVTEVVLRLDEKRVKSFSKG